MPSTMHRLFTHMFNNARVQVLPTLFLREHGCLAQEFAVDGFNAWPSHQLLGNEAFDKIAARRQRMTHTHCCWNLLLQLQLGQSGVGE